ncbi:hypothetical protein [Marinobacter sp.]|uniref:hypothetical protein n=1 Tax=Marinobacter sp. TaxID=50741 RepID=UPI003564DF2F
MAEDAVTAKAAEADAPAAQLRPGRAADPLPGTQVPGTVAGSGSESLESDNPDEEVDLASSESQNEEIEEGQESEADVDQALAESQQRKLRLMLRQCDRVLLMDFELLSMSNWPDNYRMAEARRSRDLWVLSALIAASVFLSGLTGFVPAWLAGGGFGAFVIILLLGVPFIRNTYTSKPSYMELVMQRQRMLRDARKHVEHLEGKDGLIWQCARMASYNPSLRHSRFTDLIQLSEKRVLPQYMTKREHLRLYLIYLLEAEKAYNSVQQAFFDGNQAAIDNGWQEVAARPEPRT